MKKYNIRVNKSMSLPPSVNLLTREAYFSFYIFIAEWYRITISQKRQEYLI